MLGATKSNDSLELRSLLVPRRFSQATGDTATVANHTVICYSHTVLVVYTTVHEKKNASRLLFKQPRPGAQNTYSCSAKSYA